MSQRSTAATAVLTRIAAGVATVLATGALLAAAPVMANAATGADSEPSVTASAGKPYPGDATSESQLIASEERRLIEVRSISNAAGWTNVNQGRPYRLVTGNTYTLVLIRRDAPYTLRDLEKYAPSTFVRQPDGSYVLGENIVVEQGATLRLESADGLALHLASNEDRFVTIVTLGGSIELVGTADKPITVNAWDPIAGAPDLTTRDGRSYIRVIGGHAEFQHVRFSDMGFWSGATGGLSLTGTEVPEVLSADADNNRTDEAADQGTEIFGTQLYAAGSELDTLSLEPDLEAYSYVSAVINDVQSSRNAFGLFITSADGVDIRDSKIEDSLVDGLVLHRYVTNTIVRNTFSNNNGVDGFSLTRATTGIVLDRVEAKGNGRNGISLEGGPLADGPSAMGTPVGIYGNNEVRNSTSADNGRYGIEVVGGSRIVLDDNTVTDQQMGIVVADAVHDITITDNIVEGSVAQAIALRGGITKATVQGNSIVGGQIGIYLRDAGGLIDRNQVSGVSNHAVTLINETEPTTITDNTVAGVGPSAIDVARATGDVTQDGNNTEGWRPTKPLDVILRGIFQPLTVMWILLGLIVVITAVLGIRSRRKGKNAEIAHPYAQQAPLSMLTAGVELPENLGLAPAPWMRRASAGLPETGSMPAVPPTAQPTAKHANTDPHDEHTTENEDFMAPESRILDREPAGVS